MSIKEKKKLKNTLAEFAEQLIISFFAAAMFFTYVVKSVQVVGNSMENTLVSGDRVIVGLLGKNYENGDIVIIDAETSYTLGDDGSLSEGVGLHRNIVKRVIAVGGQTVDIDFSRGAVYVDGIMLDEEYLELGLTHMDEGAFTGKYPVEVPEGYYFVLGDNRGVSMDSRSSDIGFVSEKSIVGKVLLRFSPADRFGTVR